MSPQNGTPAAPFLAQMMDRIRAEVDDTRPLCSAHNFTLLGRASFMDIGWQAFFITDQTFPLSLRCWWTYGYSWGYPAGSYPSKAWKPFYKKDRPLWDDEEFEGFSCDAAAVPFGDFAYTHDTATGDARSFAGRLVQAYTTYIALPEIRRQKYWAGMMPFGDRTSMLLPQQETMELYPLLKMGGYKRWGKRASGAVQDFCRTLTANA